MIYQPASPLLFLQEQEERSKIKNTSPTVNRTPLAIQTGSPEKKRTHKQNQHNKCRTFNHKNFEYFIEIHTFFLVTGRLLQHTEPQFDSSPNLTHIHLLYNRLTKDKIIKYRLFLTELGVL